MGDVVDWGEVGERVRESRLAAGLSQDELARHLGLDRTMVSKMEAGARRLDALELVKLSRVLDLPIGHFLSRPPAVLSRRSRAEDVAAPSARAAYTMDSTLASWLREVLQMMDFGVLERPALVRYPGSVEDPGAARGAARWLRGRLYAGDGPLGSMVEVGQRCGQFMLVVDLPGDGTSAVDGDVAVAVVGLRGDPGRRRSTAAHELGHLVLGDEYSSDLGVSASRESREAVVDAFAAELLLPIDAIRRACGKADLTRETLVGLAATYRTSWSLALRQAEIAAVIDQKAVRSWKARQPTFAEFKDALGWTPQPDLESVRVPPGFAHAVMEAWRQFKITSSRAVELMHGQLRDERDLPARPEPELEP